MSGAPLRLQVLSWWQALTKPQVLYEAVARTELVATTHHLSSSGGGGASGAANGHAGDSGTASGKLSLPVSTNAADGSGGKPLPAVKTAGAAGSQGAVAVDDEEAQAGGETVRLLGGGGGAGGQGGRSGERSGGRTPRVGESPARSARQGATPRGGEAAAPLLPPPPPPGPGRGGGQSKWAEDADKAS